MDYYKTYRHKCLEDMVEYSREVDENKVFNFLVGLNPKYDSIRIHIFGKDHFPPLHEVYSYFQKEEDRHHVMLSPSQPPSTEKSVFITFSQRGGWGGSQSCGGGGTSDFSRNDKDKLKHEYCGHSKHTNDTCWDLHGCPQVVQSSPQRGSYSGGHGGSRFTSSGRPSANLVTSTPSKTTPANSFDLSTSCFFHDEIKALRCFMSSLDTSTSIPQSSFA